MYEPEVKLLAVSITHSLISLMAPSGVVRYNFRTQSRPVPLSGKGNVLNGLLETSDI